MKNIELTNREILKEVPEICSWLDMYARNSKLTQRKYEREICAFFNLLGFKTLKDIENLKASDISKIYSASAKNGWKNNTTNQYIGTAKTFYEWANRNGIIRQNNAIFDIKKLRNDLEPNYVPPAEDMNKILDTISEHTSNKRMLVMTKLFLYGGFRKSELCSLKITDIKEDEIRVFGKGSKIKMQPVSKEILDEVRDYISTEREENILKYKQMGGKDLGYVFVSGIGNISNYTTKKKDLMNGNKVNETSFYNQLKHFAKIADVQNFEKITPHTLRRFYGTQLYEKTNDLLLCSKLLRHSSTNTTLRYISLNKEKMRSAVDNFSF